MTAKLDEDEAASEDVDVVEEAMIVVGVVGAGAGEAGFRARRRMEHRTRSPVSPKAQHRQERVERPCFSGELGIFLHRVMKT